MDIGEQIHWMEQEVKHAHEWAARWASKGSKERYRDDVAKEEIASSLRLVPKLLALKKAVENGMDDDLFDEEGQWILVGDELRAALAALDAGEGVK